MHILRVVLIITFLPSNRQAEVRLTLFGEVAMQPTTIPTAPCDLVPSEQLVLGASRVWLTEWRQAEFNFCTVKRFLSFYSAEAVAPSHHSLMYGLVTSAEKPISASRLNGTTLSDDEFRIVHAVGFMQAGRYAVAERILLRWLPPAAARIHVQQLSEFAASLSSLGIKTPIRPWRTHPPHAPDKPPPFFAAPTSMLIH
jgi:hypothetical protein